MNFYLLRIMNCSIRGPVFDNFVISAPNIVRAREIAFRNFGEELVGCVEEVKSVSLLPKDTEWLE